MLIEQEILRNNLRKILSDLEVTPSFACKKAGLSINTVQKFLKGESKSITLESLKKISQAFDLSPESFEVGKIIKIESINDNSPINKIYMKRAIELFEKDFKHLRLTENQENEILTSLYQKIVEVESMKQKKDHASLEIEQTVQKSILKIIKK